MGDELFFFDNPIELEVRDLEQRIVGGRIVPYGERIQIRGRPESFAQGALSGIKASTVKLLRDHDPRKPLGKMVSLEERADGAYAEFRVSKTQAGDEALELARDGVLSFSPGFYPGDQNQQGVHTRVQSMPETSLVTWGAYSGAKVMSVREKEVQMDHEETTPSPDGDGAVATVTPEVRELDLSPLETRMDQFQASLDKLEAYANAPGIQTRSDAPSPVEWFISRVNMAVGNGPDRYHQFQKRWSEFTPHLPQMERRVLADITGDWPHANPIIDASGLVYEEYMAGQLVNVLDTRRQFFSRLGSFPMPRSGSATIPVVTQHTLVTERATQKSEPGSRKLIVQNQDFKAKWYSGAVDVALELIAMSEIPVMSLIWEDLVGEYAVATEDALVDTIEAGGLGFTYTGTALSDGSMTYAEFITAVATQAIQVRNASGAPATRLAVTEAQWIELVSMVDAQGRRQFAVDGPTNSDAQVNPNAESFTLPGGIQVFYVPGLTQAVLFNEQSLRGSDSGPLRVEALNVTDMGRDIGLLGRTIIVPRIPAAVRVFGTDPTAS